MQFDVFTPLPEVFPAYLETSILKRARERGLIEVQVHNIRDYTHDRHHTTDDTPYGGGSGMVMRVDVLVACMESLDESSAPHDESPRAHRVLLTPQGRRLDQAKVIELAQRPALMLICGRYEGFDERVRKYVDEEVSLGDFVMTGGEVAAMAVIESTVRLLPGVLGNEESTREESHSPQTEGLLEYPQYTRPAEFRGDGVPAELLSGNHAQIAAWRRQQARLRTAERRPDLLAQKKDVP